MTTDNEAPVSSDPRFMLHKKAVRVNTKWFWLTAGRADYLDNIGMRNTGRVRVVLWYNGNGYLSFNASLWLMWDISGGVSPFGRKYIPVSFEEMMRRRWQCEFRTPAQVCRDLWFEVRWWWTRRQFAHWPKPTDAEMWRRRNLWLEPFQDPSLTEARKEWAFRRR